MKQKMKNAARTAVSFLFAGLFLYLAFRGTNPGALWKSLTAADYLIVALLFPVGFLSHWVRAYRWRYLLDPVRPGMSVRNLFAALMIGYMINNGLPRVGELVRCFVVGKLESTSKSSVLGTVVIERIIDALSFAFILCLVVFFFPASIETLTNSADSVRPIFLGGAIALLGVMILLFLNSAPLFRFMHFAARIMPTKYRDRADEIVHRFIDGLGITKMKERFLLMFGLSVLIWFLYALSLYVGFFAFSDTVALAENFGPSIVLLTVSTIAFVFPAPGAFGTYHSFMSFAMVRLYGVDPVTALSYSIITHIIGVIITTGAGAYDMVRLKLTAADLLKTESATGESGAGST